MSAVMNQEQSQQKPLAPLEQMKRAMWGPIKALCPNDEKMANSLFATALRIASDPKIMACTQSSIINCFTRAIDLDLNLDPAYGEVYFIPYKDWKENSVTELTLQIGAKGYEAMAQQLGGWIIQLIPVFNCDNYEVKKVFKNSWMETERTVEFNEAERELYIHDQSWCHLNLRAIIANARRKENGEWVTISLEPDMTRNEIERRRLISSNQKVGKYTKAEPKARLEQGLPIGVWQEHYLAMAEKTALAAIAKKLPKNKGTERLLSAINDVAIDSTATTVIETPQIPLPAPRPEIVHPEKLQNDAVADESIEDGSFTEHPENVDPETGEILNPVDPTADEPASDVITRPLITFTEERYLKGAIDACKDSKVLNELWKTVPEDVKPRFQEHFEIKQDLFR